MGKLIADLGAPVDEPWNRESRVAGKHDLSHLDFQIFG